LDGTPSGYYYRRSSAPPGSPGYSSWVIFLQGGGLCVEPVDCYLRMRTSLGSSNYWNDTFNDRLGVLSANASINPFADFNHVWVPYCSGDTHTGTLMSDDILGFYFSGHLTIVALCQHLKDTTHILNATHILLSGASAGGIGVFNNADYIRNQFPNAGLKAAPQAGYFFPSSLVIYEEWLLGIDVQYPPIASEYLATAFYSYPDESCAKANPDKVWRCWDASFVFPYIGTPFFIVNNIFDQSVLNTVAWINDGTIDSQAYLAYFGDSVTQSISSSISNTSKDAYWLVGCYSHTVNLCMGSPTTAGGLHYSEVLSDWFFEKNKLPHHIIDSCWQVGKGPCNPICTGGCG